MAMINAKDTQSPEIEPQGPTSKAIEDELMTIQNENENEVSEKQIHTSQEETEIVPIQKGSGRERAESPKVKELRKQLENIAEPDQKLSKTIEIMECALSQPGNPDFKTFWDSRKSSLDLFKENIPAGVKALYWSKYRELTKEAKRLKEMFDEQTAFAIEQIEMAIQALETDIDQFTTLLEKIDFPELPKGVRAFQNHASKYLEKQRELNLLNTQAARINALRKELIRTEMRVRLKNKFFQRLSSAGDHVFPKRKELIKEISQQFTADISDYIKVHFNELENEKSLHPIREEIKSLQAAAKLLTLNTSAFTQTRLLLSECWDKLKIAEKERKVEQAQQKQTFRANAESVRDKIKEFSQTFSSPDINIHDAQKKFDELNQFMRTKELSRDEIKTIREELNQAYKPIKNKLLNEEKKRRDIELEHEQNRQTQIKEIEDHSTKLCETINAISIENVLTEIDSIDQQIRNLELSDIERESLLKTLVPAKDALHNKEIEDAIALNPQDPERKGKIQHLLQKCLTRRNEIKERIEKYRKASGGSGLDFEQSLYFNEQLNEEKSRFDHNSEQIEKLERVLGKQRT